MSSDVKAKDLEQLRSIINEIVETAIDSGAATNKVEIQYEHKDTRYKVVVDIEEVEDPKKYL